jgi:hypothetical protein
MPDPTDEPPFNSDDLRAAYAAGYARAWWECTDDGVKRPMPPDVDDWVAERMAPNA